jgi:hypothetical protein
MIAGLSSRRELAIMGLARIRARRNRPKVELHKWRMASLAKASSAPYLN